ncbi:hypothetical protein Pla108_30240 [Botrimarina colliarenosi]|uniref:Uncharacterized protein n=1 Tax=Botrimarina colliarenosi TaxID=2528001 RepID=A0A5C6A9C6_9BACT|nr:permease prefix domain 1-containing protein [Botrimarina colliarenosi]TWT95947.1 hypothetical protein Pla108_30240 [Botrimarina colliarenosi]
MPALPYWLFPGDDRPTEEIDDEIAEELQLHLDLMAEEQERRGLAPEEAKQKAAERFGDFNQLLRRCRREKQGDVPMLLRVQTGLLVVLIALVAAAGWRMTYIPDPILNAQYMSETTELLQTIQNDLADMRNGITPPEVGTPTYTQPIVGTERNVKIPLEAAEPPAEPAGVVRMAIVPAVWTPPDNPDPQEILREVKADTQAKRYEIALAKHVWFHENANSIRPSLNAVRLSFALSDWYDLGLEYPPALELLRSIRDNLEVQILRGEGGGERFHDFAAINRVLHEDEKTVAVFTTLDSQYPDAAKSAIYYARRALIENKAFDLYAKYINAKRDYLLKEHILDLDLDRESKAKPKSGNGINDLLATSAEQRFCNEAATLVAILTIVDRKSEAAEIAALAKEKLDDEQFHREIDAALEGTIPAQ